MARTDRLPGRKLIIKISNTLVIHGKGKRTVKRREIRQYFRELEDE